MWKFWEPLPDRVAATCQQLKREIIQGWMCGWDKKQVGDWLTDPCQLETSSRHLACQIQCRLLRKGHNLQIWSCNCSIYDIPLSFSLCLHRSKWLKKENLTSDLKVECVLTEWVQFKSLSFSLNQSVWVIVIPHCSDGSHQSIVWAIVHCIYVYDTNI